MKKSRGNYMYIADLHIHSRYSRATSKECTPEHLDFWAKRKGIDILGTGDFTHPAWRKELSEKLVPAEDGLYVLKKEFCLNDRVPKGNRCPRFVFSGEISSIYKKNGRVRKVHNLILLPGLEDAERLARKLETIGNIHSDGRPILGLDSRDLLEITLELCPRAIFIPAHIWTPHFSMFGAFSSFNTIEECFEDLSPHIRAFETGLSSDPPMNWRLSALDRLQMISNSDAHSPAKLGREANLMEIELSYEGLYGAVEEGKGLIGTIEFFPEEGKYHFDGHRKCNLCLSPKEAESYHGICPVCGKKLTLGVSHRIEQLADREEGFIRQGAKKFESLVPLPEVIAASTGFSTASIKVQKQYEEMLGNLGNEFSILREIPTKEIQKKAGYLVAEGIRRLRKGKVIRLPGFDGEYGIIKLFEPSELDSMDGQMSMFHFDKGLDNIPANDKNTPTENQSYTEKTEPVHASNSNIKQISEPPVQEESLNSQQSLAVNSLCSRIAVIAGPGTGKTKTLVSRILYLLQNRRTKPSEITAVTFTNKAALEMKVRLEALLGSKRAIQNLHIGTFHNICYELLKKSGREFLLADQGATLEIAEEIIKELGITIKPSRLLQQISIKKTSGFGEGPLSEPLELPYLNQAIDSYQSKLAAMSAFDFDDLLLEALQLSKDNHEIWKKFSKNFTYLLVDEFQDISPLQYCLIKEWNKISRELFIIGDPDQAIYGFRGADAKSFLRFQKDGNTEIIYLKKNYRSTPEILNAAQKVLTSKESSVLEPVCLSGLPVRLVEASSEMAEAIFVAKEINRLIGGIDMLDMEEGFSCPDNHAPRSFGDIAVLYRTHRQAGLLEKCLKKEGIPYIVTGREEFLDNPSVRGTLGFFRSVLVPEDSLSRKLCLKLLWNLEEDCISQCVYETMAEKYQNLCKKGRPQSILSTWISDMELEHDSAMEKLLSMTVFYKTMSELLDALVFGQESDLKRCGGKRYTSDAVSLMTLHGSKGLEFPVVLLYGVKKGMIPLQYQGREIDVEEEKRLLYVGMTRAKEELILTTSGEASIFMDKLPEKIVERKKARPNSEHVESMKQMSLFDFMK